MTLLVEPPVTPIRRGTKEAWPDVTSVRRAPVRGRVARLLLTRVADGLPLQLRLPDGTTPGSADPAHPCLEIRSWSFFDRVGKDLKIGVGEGYMAQEWRPAPGSDLADVLTPFATRLTDIVPPALARFRGLVEPRQPSAEENDRTGARSNIARHYDLSNELFETFLDETMSYSAAWYDGGAPQPGTDPLATAQLHKIDGILDYAGVGPGSSVLEIGTGWGQLAVRAAQRGAIVHTITLSAEQQALARQRVAAAGMSDRVTVELRDYRDVAGQYDAVVSVEMIEAVGEQYWPTYFQAVRRALRPGGRFGLQAITMPHDRMLAARHAYGWIHKYVFPGGLIPSLEAVSRSAGAAGLHVCEGRSLGPDYARTLRSWRERFTAAEARVEALGFDATFRRMWEFYLAYSEAGFRSGHLDVWQLRLQGAR